MRRSSIRLVVAVSLSAVSLAGCGSNKDYPGATACQVPTKLVADVLGTKEFTVVEADTPLPLDADDRQSTGQYFCRIDADGRERALLIEADYQFQYEFSDKDALQKQRARFESMPSHFSHRGGVGITYEDLDDPTDVLTKWTCGNVLLQVSGETKKPSSKKSAIALTKALASRVGCYTMK